MRLDVQTLSVVTVFVTALLGAWCDADAVDWRSMWPLEACGTLGGDKAAREVA